MAELDKIELTDEIMELLFLGVKAKIQQQTGGDPVLEKLMRKELAAALRESALKEMAGE